MKRNKQIVYISFSYFSARNWQVFSFSESVDFGLKLHGQMVILKIQKVSKRKPIFVGGMSILYLVNLLHYPIVSDNYNDLQILFLYHTIKYITLSSNSSSTSFILSYLNKQKSHTIHRFNIICFYI